MGRRKIKYKQYDEFLEEERVIEVTDDRGTASNVRDEKDLERLAKNRRGVIASELRERQFIEQQADGSIKVRDERVQTEAENIKNEILNARFYPEEFNRQQYKENAERFGITEAQARNIQAREYQIRARAILAAAKAGDVKINRYTVGILNQLDRGQYERAIYGKEDSSGERQFSKGRYFSELGFSAAQKKTREGRGFVGTATAKDEMRRNFLEVSSANVAPSSNVGSVNRFARTDKPQPTVQKGLFGDDKTLKSNMKKEKPLELFDNSEFFDAPAQGSNMYGDYRPKMVLVRQEVRTQEQIDADRNRDANSRTSNMFDRFDFEEAEKRRKKIEDEIPF